MKKLFFLLVFIILLAGCSKPNIKPNNDKVGSLKINEHYTYKDLFMVKNNQLLVNDLYFDNNHQLITKELSESILADLKEEKNMPTFYINNLSNIKEIRSINNLAVNILDLKKEATNQSFKLSLADLIINKEQELKLGLDMKIFIKIFFKNIASYYVLPFNFFRPNKDKLVLEHITTGVDVEMLNYQKDESLKGLFILPGLDETIIHYENLANKFLEVNPDYNVHILNYPGFGKSSKVFLNNITDLSTWLNEIINHYEYEKISLIGAKEGALLLRYFTHEWSNITKYSFEYLLVINPISELGLGYYDKKGNAYLNEEAFANNEEINRKHLAIKLNSYKEIINDNQKYKEQLTNLDYLYLLKMCFQKTDYINKKWIFNNINLSKFKFDNGYQYFGSSKEYVFKKAQVDSSNFNNNEFHIHMVKAHMAPLKEDSYGKLLMLEKYQSGINYLLTKDYFNKKPHHFFNNYTYNMANFYFINEIINDQLITDIFKKLKERNPEPSRFLKPCDLYNAFLLHELSDKYKKLDYNYCKYYDHNLIIPDGNTAKSILIGLIKYFQDKYNNVDIKYDQLPYPYTYLEELIQEYYLKNPELYNQAINKMKHYHGIELINLLENEPQYDTYFKDFFRDYFYTF